MNWGSFRAAVVGMARTCAALVTKALRIGYSRLQRLHPHHLPGAWKNLPARRRHFIRNILVGALIAAAIHQWHESAWISDLQDSAIDVMMRVNQNLPRMRQASLGGQPLEFTFLDIDEQTYRSWGEPFFTPRDKLLQLMQFAIEGGAAVTIVDIDISRRGDSAQHDEALARFVQRLSSTPDYGRVILVRTFHAPLERATGQFAGEVRPSYLDDYVNPKALSWAQPLFKRTAKDGVVRHWQMVEMGCLGGRPVVIPSVQLETSIVLLERRRDATGEAARAAIAALTPPTCDTREFIARSHNKRLSLGPHRIQLGHPDSVGERVIYTVAWNRGPTADVIPIPARLITEGTGSLSSDLVANRVVVIGSSFAESRDLHQTPLGVMPGALIVVNAIKSLASYGQIASPPGVLRWAIELTLIIGMALAFGRWGSVAATLVVTTGIIISLIPLSFYFFKYGIWVNFAAPLLGMSIHHIISKYGESRHSATATQE